MSKPRDVGHKRRRRSESSHHATCDAGTTRDPSVAAHDANTRPRQRQRQVGAEAVQNANPVAADSQMHVHSKSRPLASPSIESAVAQWDGTVTVTTRVGPTRRITTDGMNPILKETPSPVILGECEELVTASLHPVDSVATLVSATCNNEESANQHHIRSQLDTPIPKTEIPKALAGVVTETGRTNRVTHKSTWKPGAFIVLCCALLMRILWPPTTTMSPPTAGPDSIYVPGGGFSGFWFTMGRLQSIPNPDTKSFYCYSAGCLGVVAALSNYTVGELSDSAFGVQRKWQAGDLDRYHVVDEFVKGLLKEKPISVQCLSRIHIITADAKLRPIVRQASSLLQLHEMLLQTTWIPFVLGNGFWKHGHMDGAFTVGPHPSCAHALHLPHMWDLFFNVVNVNLGEDMVRKFWKAGSEYGVH
jgi:hypothetical protein